MRQLIKKLNEAADQYYNTGNSFLSDFEYDRLYNELERLEEQTGIIYADSPTQKVGYEILSNIPKVQINPVPMLSLKKIHTNKELYSFINDNKVIGMIKCDGLSVRLIYKNGELYSANSRGNGEIGGLITSHIKCFINVPLSIPYDEDFIIDGEAIIKYNDFNNIKGKEELKNPRNAAAGSLNTLDLNIVKNRSLSFIAWDVIQGGISNIFSENLEFAKKLGFEVVYYSSSDSNEQIIEKARQLDIPCDGVVWKFEDIAYGNSLGKTAKFFNNAIAWKPANEMCSTMLRDIEWSMGRTGQITPIAIFDDIDFGDSVVNRASLHNLSIIDTLFGEDGPHKGQIIRVSKRNMIIPCVEEVDLAPEDSERIKVPTICPCCGKPVEKRTDCESTFLYCGNPDCSGKIINRIDFFVGKKGLDIKGLSKATLEKLIDWGWVNNCGDIFTLSAHRDEWVKKSGFGIASVDKVLKAIESSSVCDLDKFICAIGIPLIGSTASKELAKSFKDWNAFMDAVDSGYKFYQLSGFGREMSQAISNFDYTEARYIAHNFITFKEKVSPSSSNGLEGKTFVITGKLMSMNRDSLKEKIEELGGKVTGSVSSKTSYLINNDSESTSSKNMSAKKLGIPIITEKEFFNLIEN